MLNISIHVLHDLIAQTELVINEDMCAQTLVTLVTNLKKLPETPIMIFDTGAGSQEFLFRFLSIDDTLVGNRRYYQSKLPSTYLVRLKAVWSSSEWQSKKGWIGLIDPF
jgi:hypothetical protein